MKRPIVLIFAISASLAISSCATANSNATVKKGPSAIPQRDTQLRKLEVRALSHQRALDRADSNRAAQQGTRSQPTPTPL